MASAGGGSRGSVRPERHVQTGRGGNGASSSVRTKSAPPKRPSSSSSAKSSIDSDNAAGLSLSLAVLHFGRYLMVNLEYF